MAKEADKQHIIDGHFFVPPGVVDVRQAVQEDGVSSYTEDLIASNLPTLAAVGSNVPIPPTSYTVIEQRVRISSDGTSVVDVTIEFPDIPGVQKIDVGVTKI